MQRDPVIYEINTWPWLAGLADDLGRPVTLATVPDAVWDTLPRVDAVWLMGVWQRSPAGVAIALADAPLVQTFTDALSDYRPADVVGSPYCIRDYVVDEHLGGPSGLAVARRALADRGIALILDFVPNHLAIDHRWATEHPERFVHGSPSQLAAHPDEYVVVGTEIIANGRDPYFPPWRDVLQLNPFHRGTRTGAVAALGAIAQQCDGVRVDMAMLMCTAVVTRTWGCGAGPVPATEYWSEVIPAIRDQHPNFLFIAESYWRSETVLREQGFDHCYDKEFTDTIEHHPDRLAERIAGEHDRSGAVRFLENHDEPRARAVFGGGERTAAVTAFTQPGARLIHHGQLDGARRRLPVQMGRGVAEAADPDLAEFYRRLLSVLAAPGLHGGTFALLPIEGWHDNAAGAGLIAWSWTAPGLRLLVVVNLDDAPGAGRIATPWPELDGTSAHLFDPITGEHFTRPPDPDAYVFAMLPGWGAHVLKIEPRASSRAQ